MAKPLTAKSLYNRLRRFQDKGDEMVEKLAEWADEINDPELHQIVDSVCDNMNLIFFESPRKWEWSC